jgi:hypothetical protein
MQALIFDTPPTESPDVKRILQYFLKIGSIDSGSRFFD